MTASCRGLCYRFKSHSFRNMCRYADGYKRRSYCSVFMKITSLRCPCCALKLRTKLRVNPKRRGFHNV